MADKIFVQALGVTTKSDSGEIVMAMLQDDMPEDCVAVFVKKADYPELLKRMAGKESL